MFSAYSIIHQNDTLADVRVIDFMEVGDSVIKHKNESLIRVVRESEMGEPHEGAKKVKQLLLDNLELGEKTTSTR